MKDSRSTKTTTTRGGRRAGAGRPRSDTVALQARVMAQTDRAIRRAAAEGGQTLGQVIDRLADTMDEV